MCDEHGKDFASTGRLINVGRKSGRTKILHLVSFLLIAATFVLGQAQPPQNTTKTREIDRPTKPANNAETARSLSSNSSNTVSTPQAVVTPEPTANHVKLERDSKEGFSSPSWVMVYLTACYVLISALAFGAILRQTTVAKIAAEAARTSAEATAKSVATVYGIERPWVLGFIEQELHEQVTMGVRHYRHLCTIKNVGKTPAWVLSWTSKRKDVAPDILPTKPDYGEIPDSAPQLLPPNESLSMAIDWLPVRFEEAHRDERFLYVFGFVSYRDLLGGEVHETRFCWRYYPPFRENKAQGFHLGGPPEYNKYS